MPLRSGKHYKMSKDSEDIEIVKGIKHLESNSKDNEEIINSNDNDKIARTKEQQIINKIDAATQISITPNMAEKDNLTNNSDSTLAEGCKNLSLGSKSSMETSDFIKFDPELGLNFNSWLTHFNNKSQELNLDDSWKIRNFQKFIGGSALKLFVNECLNCTSFQDITEIFQEHFFTPTTTFLDFQNLTFSGKAKDLSSYFTKKVELGRKIQLGNSHIIEGLSVGLPSQIKALLILKEPQSPKQWLEVVSKIIKEFPEESKVNENKFQHK